MAKGEVRLKELPASSGQTWLPQREEENWWAEVFARNVFNPINFPFLEKMEGAFNSNDTIFKNPIWSGFGFQKLWSVPEIKIYHKSNTYSFK